MLKNAGPTLVSTIYYDLSPCEVWCCLSPDSQSSQLMGTPFVTVSILISNYQGYVKKMACETSMSGETNRRC